MVKLRKRKGERNTNYLGEDIRNEHLTKITGKDVEIDTLREG